ncbi:MAG TPA: hypothetical protein PKL08_14875, partial [Thermoanaerobaculaceae bacterium]|nr:hypothetical protein [Thermoanaerobaculaceae bacterium]
TYSHGTRVRWDAYWVDGAPAPGDGSGPYCGPVFEERTVGGVDGYLVECEDGGHGWVPAHAVELA